MGRQQAQPEPFHWTDDQSYTANCSCVHHQVPVSLIKKFFPSILMWLRDDYPLLELYAIYDNWVSAAALAAA